MEPASNIDENVTEVKTVLDTAAVDVEGTNKVVRCIDRRVTEMMPVLDTVAVDVEETNKVARRVDRRVTELRDINLDIAEDVLDVKWDTSSIRKDVKAARRGA